MSLDQGHCLPRPHRETGWRALVGLGCWCPQVSASVAFQTPFGHLLLYFPIMKRSSRWTKLGCYDAVCFGYEMQEAAGWGLMSCERCLSHPWKIKASSDSVVSFFRKIHKSIINKAKWKTLSVAWSWWMGVSIILSLHLGTFRGGTQLLVAHRPFAGGKEPF